MTTTKKTQCERIIDYINKYGSITVREMSAHLGIGSPRKRISELQSRGYQFKKTVEKGKNRFGEPTHYIRYSFQEAENGSVQN